MRTFDVGLRSLCLPNHTVIYYITARKRKTAVKWAKRVHRRKSKLYYVRVDRGAPCASCWRLTDILEVCGS